MRFRGSGPGRILRDQKNRTLAVRFFFARDYGNGAVLPS